VHGFGQWLLLLQAARILVSGHVTKCTRVYIMNIAVH
jgi:hypothetical protein